MTKKKVSEKVSQWESEKHTYTLTHYSLTHPHLP